MATGCSTQFISANYHVYFKITKVFLCMMCFLYLFTYIFIYLQLFGMLIMAIGLYGVVFTAQDLHGLKSVEIAYIVITDLSGVMVALGSIIFLVSFAGCVGALRENLCLLKLVSKIRFDTCIVIHMNVKNFKQVVFST